MIKVSVEYSQLRDLQGRFRRIADTEAPEAVEEGVTKATELVYREAQNNIRSMFKTSGRMENALRMTIDRAGSNTFGSITIEPPYSIHEVGGRRAFAIFPRGGRRARSGNRPGALLFEGEAGQVFTPYVLHPPLPERSFLRKALDDKRAEITELFGDIIRAKFVNR